MITITIGRDENNRIIIEDPAQIVSNYHAELKIKEDGSMFLYDKSSNGTFVNGTRIPKNQDFPVFRGNAISFANKVILNWALVPDVPASADTIRIMTIGKKPDNDIQLSATERTSRYHALLRITKDYNYYIYDTSVNGTFVNNLRVPERTYQKIKYGDTVRFGDTDKLNWALVPRGKTKFSIRKSPLIRIAAIVLPVLAIGAIALSLWMRSGNLYEKYENSVCMVVNQFVYTIDFGELGKFELSYGFDPRTNRNNLLWYEAGVKPVLITGTGFFISKDGKLITNRHVARPWSVVEKDDADIYNGLVATARNVVNYRVGLLVAADSAATTPEVKAECRRLITAWTTAKPTYGGRSISVAIALNNVFISSEKDLIDCEVLRVSDDDKVDIALLQTNNKILPSTVRNLVDVDKALPDDELKPGKKIFILGFPMGFSLAKTSQGIKANFQNGQVSRVSDGFSFGHNIEEVGGASGSPVFDEDGHLAGVHYAGIGNTAGFKFAVAASQVKKLMSGW